MYCSPCPSSGLALRHVDTPPQHACKEHPQQRYEIRCNHPTSERTVQQYGFRDEKVLRWADVCQRLPRHFSSCPASPTAGPITRVWGHGGAQAGESDVQYIRMLLSHHPTNSVISYCFMHRLGLRTRSATGSEHSTHPTTPLAKRTRNTNRTSLSTTPIPPTPRTV